MVPETAWFSSVRASKLNGGTLRHAMLTSQSASRYDGRITRGAPCRYTPLHGFERLAWYSQAASQATKALQ
ncbi:hypothetical protein QR685DRAFT_442616 [Neurospora intermedia]|uniref:Uncharacterized protein n=1 Tax=Neurospora intermedia TaxID=5142 RepID=A0ABR3DGW8_NEUIN